MRNGIIFIYIYLLRPHGIEYKVVQGNQPSNPLCAIIWRLSLLLALLTMKSYYYYYNYNYYCLTSCLHTYILYRNSYVPSYMIVAVICRIMCVTTFVSDNPFISLVQMMYRDELRATMELIDPIAIYICTYVSIYLCVYSRTCAYM